MPAHPKEVRKARSYLRQSAGARTSDISPLKFANAAKEQNVGFPELLKFIGRMYSGGQDQEGFREDLLSNIAAKGGN